MKGKGAVILLLLCMLIPVGLAAEGVAEKVPRSLAEIDQDDSCLSCHQAVSAVSWKLPTMWGNVYTGSCGRRYPFRSGRTQKR